MRHYPESWSRGRWCEVYSMLCRNDSGTNFFSVPSIRACCTIVPSWWGENSVPIWETVSVPCPLMNPLKVGTSNFWTELICTKLFEVFSTILEMKSCLSRFTTITNIAGLSYSDVVSVGFMRSRESASDASFLTPGRWTTTKSKFQ